MINFTPTDEQIELCDQICKWFRDYESGHRIRNHPQWYSYSGGAGVGKTTVLELIIDKLKLSEDQFITIAFTGKAALNLQQKGLPSCTVHSLIYHTVLEKVPYIDEDGETQHKMAFHFILKESLPDNLSLM